MPDERKLKCVPDDVTLNCETSARTTVRVRTSDKKAGVEIQALGFDSSRVIVNPDFATTNDKGYIDVEIQCQGGAFCPSRTTVTFADSNGSYEECELDVDCERLPDDDGDGAVLGDTSWAVALIPVNLAAPGRFGRPARQPCAGRKRERRA